MCFLNKYKKPDDPSIEDQSKAKPSESPTLDSAAKTVDATKDKDKTKDNDKKLTLAEEDYQLNEAINVLKGLSVVVKN